MKRVVGVITTLLLVVTLSACSPLVGTVTFKVYEPARSWPESGYVTKYRTETYIGTCSRTTTSNGKTNTTSYSCSKTRRVSYRAWDTWIEHQPACWRIGVEYIDENHGDKRNTTRCVSERVWSSLTVGGHYDSSVNK